MDVPLLNDAIILIRCLGCLSPQQTEIEIKASASDFSPEINQFISGLQRACRGSPENRISPIPWHVPVIGCGDSWSPVHGNKLLQEQSTFEGCAKVHSESTCDAAFGFRFIFC